MNGLQGRWHWRDPRENPAQFAHRAGGPSPMRPSMDLATAVPIRSTRTVFRDGFGERRLASDPASTPGTDALEMLCLSPELTSVPSFEFALRERAGRLGRFRHSYYGVVRSVDRLSEPDSKLAIVSERS